MKSDELKQKAKHELIEYAVNVVYLAIVFAAFTWYRRLILASYDISLHELLGRADRGAHSGQGHHDRRHLPPRPQPRGRCR